MAPEDLDTLRATVLEIMRNSSFYTDAPGITYEHPDVLEYRYGDCGGGELCVRLSGERMVVRVISGEWSGLPENENDDSNNDFKTIGVLMDPRRALAYLTDIGIEQENENRVLTGRIAVERLGEELVRRNPHRLDWWSHMTDEEMVRCFSPKVRFVLDKANRVVRMKVTVATQETQGAIHDLGELHFFYR